MVVITALLLGCLSVSHLYLKSYFPTELYLVTSTTKHCLLAGGIVLAISNGVKTVTAEGDGKRGSKFSCQYNNRRDADVIGPQ